MKMMSYLSVLLNFLSKNNRVNPAHCSINVGKTKEMISSQTVEKVFALTVTTVANISSEMKVC